MPMLGVHKNLVWDCYATPQVKVTRKGVGVSILSMNSYTDLLKKCIWENNQLRNCSTHPEYDYILLNIIFAMNHIFEWYLKDIELSDGKKLECIKLFNPYSETDYPCEFKTLYKKLVDYPNVNEYQKTIRLLCNKAKHFKTAIIERQEKHFISSFGNSRFSENGSSFGSFDHYSYFVEINSNNVDLLKLISSQLSKWEEFVKINV